MTPNRERRLVAAFDRGRAANGSGRPIADNPHPPSNAEFYQAWAEGWIWEEGPVYSAHPSPGEEG